MKKILLIIILLIAVGVAGMVFFRYYPTYKKGVKMVDTYKKISQMDKKDFDLTINISDNRSEIKMMPDRRIAREEAKNFLFMESGFLPLLPENLPNKLYWGDISIVEDGIIFSIGQKNEEPEEILDIVLGNFAIYVFEYKTKPDAWDNILKNLMINKKEVLFNNTYFYGGQMSSQEMVMFEKNGIWVNIIQLTKSGDYLSTETLIEIAKSFQ